MYKVYFDELELPVTPDALKVKIKGANKTLTLINDGEINVLKTPGLTEISFDFLLPMLGKYSFSSEYHRPDFYLAKLEDLMTELKPFRFIVSRLSPNGGRLYDTNMLVSLEDYDISEKAENGLDVTVSVKLKQYRPYATKTLTVTENDDGSYSVSEDVPRDTPDYPNGRTHKVVKGDSLWGIARKYMGSGSKYKKLYAANKKLIDEANQGTHNPWYAIYPGQVLSIP